VAVTAVQRTGAKGTTLPTISVAMSSNVTAGNVVIVGGICTIAFEDPDPFVSGDCTKIAGTATIGTITLRAVFEQDRGDGVLHELAIWEVPITGTGSLTMQITNDTTLNNAHIAAAEYTSDVGTITFVAGQTSSATGTGTAAASGTVTTTRNGIIFGVMAVDTAESTTLTPDAAFTTVFEEENGFDEHVGACADRVVTGSVADSADWTLQQSHFWTALAAAFVEPADAGPTQIAVPAGAVAMAGVVPTLSLFDPLANDARIVIQKA
jgi:hypothetical protein